MTHPTGLSPADLHIVSELDLLRLQRTAGVPFGPAPSCAHPTRRGLRQDPAFELVQDELERRDAYPSTLEGTGNAVLLRGDSARKPRRNVARFT
ncbi:hypothetical protein [Arthrobacter sp. B1805]|uniref:hypothetical protein n=1 Tax=Arthrobacter sp. B1805 TaxID=2058892 RepID=UPI000CE3A84E|nr:hypothetical protein [Arthrobacter sp. B1805]